MTAAAPIAARRVKVAAIEDAGTDIKTFDLVAADGRPLSSFEAGAHIDVHIPSGPVRQYSICSDPRESGFYRIAVKRERAGRGGSIGMHEALEKGSIIGIGTPKNHFPVAASARRHIFVAGGIGITPIMAMIRHVSAQGGDWELHYCARSKAHAAFFDDLKTLAPARVFEYFSETPLLNVVELTATHNEGEHIYCCGPEPLMQAVKDATRHWPDDHAHFEWFSNAHANEGPNLPFEVELKRSGKTLTVPAGRSILEVLRESGVIVASSCEDGVCGTCETVVLEGEPDHRDTLLTEKERAESKTMMICVSRAKGDRLVLDV